MFVIPVNEFDSQFLFGYDIAVKEIFNLDSVSVHELEEPYVGKPKSYVVK